MECNSCLSSEYLIKEDFTFECKFCLNEIEQPSFVSFLDEFKAAYISDRNLSSVINSYFDDVKHLAFPFLIRDYVHSNYNYSIIANEIRKLPIHEINLILDITGSNTKVGFSFTRSSEILDQIVLHQDNLPDLHTRLELLTITIANEQGSFPYESMDDVGYIYMDPKGNDIVQSYKKTIKSLTSKVQNAAAPILDLIQKKLKTQSKYFEECSSASKFVTEPFDDGLKITQCTDKSKIIRIPPTIHGVNVIAIGEKSFVSNKASVIEIPFTVREIAAHAFVDQQNLTYFKIGNHIPLRADMFVNCPSLQIIETINSHLYKEVDGVIYSKDSRELIYFPPALVLDTFTIEGPKTIKEGSCAQSRYLKSVTFDSAVVIENNAFRTDEMSSLNAETLKLIKAHKSVKNDSFIDHSSNVSNQIEHLSDSKVNRVGFHSLEDYLRLAQEETQNVGKLQFLLRALDVSENYLDQAKVMDELLKFDEGVSSILKLSIKEPYLYYYTAMAKVKKSSDDQEKILQYFLDAYHAGNSKAGINASTMLKKGNAGVVDLTMAERILVDLSEKNNLDAMLKLVLMYNENPHLCTRDITPMIASLNEKNYHEFSAIYADLLYKGTIIPQDIEQSISIMKTLSDNGNKNASYQLGYIYVTDESLRDSNEAINYFNKAHLQGHPDAKRAILKIKQ
jgi:hypothetical protein